MRGQGVGQCAVMMIFIVGLLCMPPSHATSIAIPHLDVDLRSGSGSPSLPAGMVWHSSLTSSSSCTCDRRGVLKLTFSSTRVRAEINMTFETSQGFSFNVGDSATNNGYAGDANTQNNDAEVHSVNNNLLVYSRDNPSGGAGGSYGLLHSQANYVGVQPYTTLTLNVKDELVTAHNGFQYLYLNSYKLFALSGQSDSASGGVNYDVYLGLNRVVHLSPSSRTGSGLCRVTVKFYPS